MRAVVWGEECTRMRMTVSLVLDGEAAAPVMRALALHLGRCEHCRQFTAGVAAATHELRASAAGGAELRGRTYIEGGRS